MHAECDRVGAELEPGQQQRPAAVWRQKRAAVAGLSRRADDRAAGVDRQTDGLRRTGVLNRVRSVVRLERLARAEDHDKQHEAHEISSRRHTSLRSWGIRR